MHKHNKLWLALWVVPLLGLVPTLSEGVVNVSGNISSDTTWFKADTVYRVTGDVTVLNGVTLTIEPGVIVKFNAYTRLNVHGKLVAEGANTSDSLIYFTSIKDDNIGGDTNGDGIATSPAKRDWAAIKFYADCDDSSSLEWCKMSYGGHGNIGAIEMDSASVAISHCTIFESYYGVMCTGNSSPTISNTEIQVCTMTPIAIELSANPTFDSVAFSARDNGYDAFGLLGGTFTGTSTLRKRNGAGTENVTYVLLQDVTIGAGASFTIKPGIVIKLLNHNVDFIVEGTLIADGIPDSQIVFTSVKDDNYGNPQDTNNDGSQTAPATDDWGAISFKSTSSACILDNCAMRFGSHRYSHSPSYDKGVVAIDNSDPTVSNCIISDNRFGISIRNLSSPTISNTSILNSTYTPILMSISSSPAFSGLQFTNNGYTALGIVGDTIAIDCTFPRRNVAGYTNITYWMNNNVIVASGATVTVAPGVVVKFRRDTYAGVRLIVNGALVADGKPDSLIVFSSERDDNHGNPMDTNNDGPATIPNYDDWGSVEFTSGSDDVTCLIDRCVVNYGGMRYWSGDHHHGGVRLSNAGPTISNSLFHGNRYGIECDGNSDPDILNNQVTDSEYTPIWMSLKSSPTFSGNSFSGNRFKALGIMEGTLSSDATLVTRTVAGIPNIAYLALSDITIASGAKLTIGPGVVVKLNDWYRRIVIEGALEANGTADSMVVFTSVKDDAHGGDTNNDGNATTPSPDDWRQICFTGTSVDSLCVLDYCHLLFGGSDVSGNQKGMIQTNSASPTISHSIISDSYYGVVCIGNSNPVLTDNQFLNSTYLPVVISLASNPTFGGGNQFLNNGYTGIGIYGETIASDVTLPRRNAAGFDNITYILDENLTISSGATVTVEPGVVVKFSRLPSNDRLLTIEGALVADGKSDSLIVFTSGRDDSYGNPMDTNGDGAVTEPASGDWWSIKFLDTSDDGVCILDHCVVNYGGHRYQERGGVELSNAAPTISNCSFHGNTYGIECGGVSDPSITNSDFTGSQYTPVYMSLMSNPTFSGNTFSNNGYKALGIIGEELAADATLIKRSVGGIANIPYVLIQQNLTVGSGAILTIEPGIVIKLRQDRSIIVKKALKACGGSTPDSLIVFTSDVDDFYGGDTNNDGDSTTPSPGFWGSWHSIKYESTSFDPLDTLKNCVIRYGGDSWDGYGALETNSASPTIIDCRICENRNGIYAKGASNPTINHCDIYGNVHHAVRNVDEAFVINAENCWWGDGTGPADTSDDATGYNPGGLGDHVSNWVDYDPWTTTQVENPELGDVSRNGEIRAYDGALVLRHVALLDTLDAEQLLLAEVSGNGNVSAFDASLILQYVAGMINYFPAESAKGEEAGLSSDIAYKVRIGEIENESEDELKIGIRVEDGTDICSGELLLSYNPGILSVKSVSTGSLLSKFSVVYNDKENGFIRLGMAGATPLEEGGVLFDICFSVDEEAGYNQHTTLSLSRVQINERDFTDQAGSFHVTLRQKAIPRVFALGQNSPNPFGRGTTIRYQLPVKSQVSLRIYNATGRLVKTLANGKREAGYHSVLWRGKDDNGRNLSNGVYFYRITTDRFSTQKKLILAR
jgi:parallel beta-helix repeat protein